MNKVIFGDVLALAGSTAHAATVYDVNQTIGLGSVVGTIQTNGTLGTLGVSDITGFSLTVTAPGASVLLTQANSAIVQTGGNFSATANSLLFNYSGAAGYLLFQQGSFGTGMRYYCNASTDGDCFQGASAVPESFNSASAQYAPRSGQQVIANIAGTVPEPASWALMIAGFAMAGLARRRVKPATVAA